MECSSALREKMYRTYLEFFEVAERKRHWNIFDDVPWEKLDASGNCERKAICIETFCAEELYLPDYSSIGLALTRQIFGAAWFQACWAYEESKHGLVFREYLTRSGLRSEAQFAVFESDVFSRVWSLPFATVRQMVCYGALQEVATYLAYKAQKDKATRDGDKVLEAIFFYVSRDPDYQERLQTSGAGISTRQFLEHGLFPTLKTLGTSRTELRVALQQNASTFELAYAAK